MCCFCFAEHTSKCAFAWPTTGSRLLFQTSSSAPEQKDHILAILFQLFILSPVISSSKSLAHYYKGKSQSNLTKVHTATWNNSSKMLWCTYKGIFAFQVLICTLGDTEKFLYHNGCLQQVLSSTLQPWRTHFFPSIFTPAAFNHFQTNHYGIHQNLFVWSSDRFLEKGWGLIHLIDTREDQFQV